MEEARVRRPGECVREHPEATSQAGAQEESWAKVKERMNVALTVECEETLQHPGREV